MIIGKIKKRGIENKVVWFSRNIKLLDCIKDATYYSYLGKQKFLPFIRKKSHTLINNLTLSDDSILLQAKSNTRNEVRRAIKDGYEYTNNITISEFVTFYNLFALEKGLPNISDKKLQKWGEHIMFSAVKKDNLILTMHAHLIDNEEKIANLLHSASCRLEASSDAKMIGISNRFLHYKDMLELKKQGIMLYDFGGVYIGTTDKARMGIAEFKKSFGGEIKVISTYYSPLAIAVFIVDKLIYSFLKK